MPVWITCNVALNLRCALYPFLRKFDQRPKLPRNDRSSMLTGQPQRDSPMSAILLQLQVKRQRDSRIVRTATLMPKYEDETCRISRSPYNSESVAERTKGGLCAAPSRPDIQVFGEARSRGCVAAGEDCFSSDFQPGSSCEPVMRRALSLNVK